MNSSAYTAIFIILLSALEITSRTLLKKAYEESKVIYIFISVLLYLTVISLLYYSMRYAKFITVSALWDAGTIVLASISSYFILKETINRGEFIGLGLITSGVIAMAVSTTTN